MSLTIQDCQFILDNLSSIPDHQQPVVAWLDESVEKSIEAAQQRLDKGDVPKSMTIGAIDKTGQHWNYIEISRTPIGFILKPDEHSGVEHAAVERYEQIFPAVKHLLKLQGSMQSND